MTAEPLPHATARSIALTALAIGLAGNVLLRVVPWGVSALLWTMAFLIGVLSLLRRHRPVRLRDLAFPIAAALIGATGLAWRRIELLYVLDVLTLFTALAMLCLGPRGIRIHAAAIVHIVVAVLVTLGQSIAGLFHVLFDELSWRRDESESTSGFGTFARGFLIALPALVIFGALLASADAAFARLLKNILVFELEDVFAQLMLIAFITAVCIGFFRSLVGGPPATLPSAPEFLRLGAGELTVATTLIDLLFAAFVAVQFRYLFGGDSVLVVVPGLTYAEYARRGFFELVLVVALVIPMLLVAEWLIDKREAGAVRRFRIAAGVQVLLVLVIALSAWRRMALYRQEFGLSEDRFFTSAFIVWLSFVLVWLALTVLTGRRERFFLGMAASGMATLLIVHALDPAAVIVRTNAGRAETGARKLDASYVTALGSDATPAILAHFEMIPADAKPCIARKLLEDDARRGRDWRTWTWSRSRAHAAVEAHRVELMTTARDCVRRRPPQRLAR